MALDIQSKNFLNDGTAHLTLINGGGRIIGTLILTDQKIVEDVQSRNAVAIEFKYRPFATIQEVGAQEVK